MERKSMITWGMILAAILSWTVNHSLAWAIIHGFCSWLYVIWYCLNRLR